jgi:hypothetical protein
LRSAFVTFPCAHVIHNGCNLKTATIREDCPVCRRNKTINSSLESVSEWPVARMVETCVPPPKEVAQTRQTLEDAPSSVGNAIVRGVSHVFLDSIAPSRDSGITKIDLASMPLENSKTYFSSRAFSKMQNRSSSVFYNGLAVSRENTYALVEMGAPLHCIGIHGDLTPDKLCAAGVTLDNLLASKYTLADLCRYAGVNKFTHLIMLKLTINMLSRNGELSPATIGKMFPGMAARWMVDKREFSYKWLCRQKYKGSDMVALGFTWQMLLSIGMTQQNITELDLSFETALAIGLTQDLLAAFCLRGTIPQGWSDMEIARWKRKGSCDAESVNRNGY